MDKCKLCPRECKVNRKTELGFCGEKGIRIAHAMLHKWEEPIISGERGSGAIFFSGCNMKCVYCQNYELSRGLVGKNASVEELVKLIKDLESAGAHNINLVTPTHFVREIKEALEIYKPKIPVVWNTSGYENPEIIDSLKGYVDVFLTDIKYYSDESGVKYSSAPNYFKLAGLSTIAMRGITGEDIIENGIMTRGLIIRILLLPGFTNETIKILEWIKDNLGEGTIISIMNQYLPMGEAKNCPEINRKVTRLEYKRVVMKAKELGFKNAFIQEETSASEEFVPEFKKDKSFGF